MKQLVHGVTGTVVTTVYVTLSHVILTRNLRHQWGFFYTDSGIIDLYASLRETLMYELDEYVSFLSVRF